MSSTVKSYYGNHVTNITAGALGLAIASIGTAIPGSPYQKYFLLVGPILLAYSAFMERDKFFTVLQLIIIIDAVFDFLYLPNWAVFIITCLLVIGAVVHFAMKGVFKDKALYLGVAGLFALAMGIGLLNPLWYLTGGILLTGYALIGTLRGSHVSLVFLILNAVYIIAACIGTYEWLTK